MSLDDWLAALLVTPGLTGISDPAEARRALLEDSLRAVPLVERYDGPVVDVGSGGGAPGIPLAAVLPEREVTLLEANGRKCEFLRSFAPPNVTVVRGRAEEQATTSSESRSRRRSRRRRSPRSGACRSSAPGGAACSSSGPSAGRRPRRAGRRALAAELVETPAGIPRAARSAARRRRASRGARGSPGSVRSAE